MHKIAEVRGVLAAFCDAGLVKVASADAFDDLAEKVARCLEDSYTVDDVADATRFVVKLAEDAKRPSLRDSAKKKATDFGNAAKSYVTKDLGFGRVGRSVQHATDFGKGKNGVSAVKKELAAESERAGKAGLSEDMKKSFSDRLAKAKSTRNRLWGRAGKSLLKALGKTSVPALALYGGGKLLGGLFGSGRPGCR